MAKLITKQDAKMIAKALCRKFPEEDADGILAMQKKIVTWIFNRRKARKNCAKCNMLCRGKIPDFKITELGIKFDWSLFNL